MNNIKQLAFIQQNRFNLFLKWWQSTLAQGLKIKAIKKDCRLIIKIKLPKDSEISDNYLSVVSRNFVRGFFKPQSVKKHN